MELNIETLNPTLVQLQEMVQATRKITLDDLTDKAQLKIVHDNRVVLAKTRVELTKKGKQMREDALSFQKAVIQKEKELIAIITPEEDRLQALEDAAEKQAEVARRQGMLPSRKATLISIGDTVECPDEQLLTMDDKAFQEYYNSRVTTKNEADRVAFEAEKRKFEEDKARLAREKEIREAEELARKKERERFEQQERERKEREHLDAIEAEKRQKEAAARKEQEERDRIVREKREKEEAIERARQEERDRFEKQERERLEKEERARQAAEAEQKRKAEEQERVEKQKKYQSFKIKAGWTEEAKAEFREENTGTSIILWKKVGEFGLIK